MLKYIALIVALLVVCTVAEDKYILVPVQEGDVSMILPLGCSHITGSEEFIAFNGSILIYTSCSVQKDQTLETVTDCPDCKTVGMLPDTHNKIIVREVCSTSVETWYLVPDTGCLGVNESFYNVTLLGTEEGINVDIYKGTERCTGDIDSSVVLDYAKCKEVEERVALTVEQGSASQLVISVAILAMGLLFL